MAQISTLGEVAEKKRQEKAAVPTHAITLWLTDETITIQYPDGQQIPIPANEPGRIVSILRSQALRNQPVDKMLAFRREFQLAWPQEVEKKMAAVRKKADDEKVRTANRKEKEKEMRMKKVEKRRRVEEAEKLLALVGL